MTWHSTVLCFALFAQAPEVVIAPTQIVGTQETSGPNFLSKKGFDLATMLGALYDTNAGRIVLPVALNDKEKRYDFLVKVPEPVGEKELKRLMREGIERQFKLSRSVEHRDTDVYVMRAMPGRLRPVNAGQSQMTTLNQSHMTLEIGSGEEAPAEAELQKAMQTAVLTEINVSGEMGQIRLILERGLHRAVVDETGLKGVYDVRTDGHAKTTEDFLKKLKEQTGLEVVPARRSLEFLVFRLGVN